MKPHFEGFSCFAGATMVIAQSKLYIFASEAVFASSALPSCPFAALNCQLNRPSAELSG